jgi:hypothetical protein
MRASECRITLGIVAGREADLEQAGELDHELRDRQSLSGYAAQLSHPSHSFIERETVVEIPDSMIQFFQ